MLTVFSPRPNAAKIAALISRELTLIERLQSLGPKLALRKRAEIACELAVVRRLLEELGYFGEGRSAQPRRKRDDRRSRSPATSADPSPKTAGARPRP